MNDHTRDTNARDRDTDFRDRDTNARDRDTNARDRDTNARDRDTDSRDRDMLEENEMNGYAKIDRYNHASIGRQLRNLATTAIHGVRLDVCGHLVFSGAQYQNLGRADCRCLCI